MKSFEDIDDFGRYGIFGEECALYPEARDMLNEALESEGDFNTGWHGFKKECQSMCVVAYGDTIIVSVAVFMDDPEDLMFDFDHGELTDEQVDEVLDMWWNSEYSTELDASREIPRNSSLIDIMKAATEMADELNDELEVGFAAMQDFVGIAEMGVK